MPDEKSVFEINAELAARLAAERAKRWKERPRDEIREAVREVAGVRRLGELPETNATTVSTLRRDGYRIDKLVLSETEETIPLPGLLFVPDGDVRVPPILYLHGQSMKADAEIGGPIERLVRAGHVVLAAELTGIGETETGHDKRDYGRGRFGLDSQEIYLAYLLGKSYVGMRTEDVFRWTRLLARRLSQKQPRPVRLIALGEAAVPALHAAALEPARFELVRIEQMISSWEEVVRATEHLNQLVNTVHGALGTYDLPNLVDLAGPDKVTVEAPVDPLGQARLAAPSVP